MSPSRLPIRVVLSLSLASLLLPAAASAQVPRLRVGLDLGSNQSWRSQASPAESVKRRVAASLVPALEAAGYEVVRVQDYRDARRAGRYEAIIRVNVEARDVFLASDARVLDKAQAPKPIPSQPQSPRAHVEAELSASVEAWATWAVWDGEVDKKTGEGRIAPRTALVEGQGDSASLDDEENIARVLSDDIGQALLPALDIAVTPRLR
jgi:hypothetical protein